MKCLRCGAYAERYAQCCDACMVEYMDRSRQQSVIQSAQVRCTITDVDGHVHEVKPVTAERQPVDPRMQVVLGLLPADAVFIVRRGYVVDPDSDNPTTVDALLWRPKASGYVSEYNPWQAGLYKASGKDYAAKGEDPNAHSYSGTVEDCDCPLRVLGKLPKEQA